MSEIILACRKIELKDINNKNILLCSRAVIGELDTIEHFKCIVLHVSIYILGFNVLSPSHTLFRCTLGKVKNNV